MLQAIQACKVYRTSSRKDKILAAIDNPINSELVGQLAEALNEEYQTPEFLVKDREPKDSPATAGPAPGSAEPSSESRPSVGLGGHSSAPSSPAPESAEPNPDAEPSDTDAPEGAEGSSAEPASSVNPGPANVQESTNTEGTKIVGSQIRNMFKDMRQVSDQIKGMLNFKGSTAGVNRILCKEHELWIYYNDDINLNNVMADVIETLNASSYTYLEFNRLARSDNAIVFQIDFPDTDNVVQANPANK